MKLSIINKLKRKQHKNIALLQDVVISILYRAFPDAVLHGGTSVWRCYHGSRFSEDIDIYLDKGDVKDIAKIEKLKRLLLSNNLRILKFKMTDNAIYSKVAFNRTEIRFEASFLRQKKKIILADYETVDGNSIKVFTLSPEELIKEKVNAYLSRFLVRDIYDISILLPFVNNKRSVIKCLNTLVKKFKKPKDEEVLKSILLVGSIPSSKHILEYIKAWLK